MNKNHIVLLLVPCLLAFALLHSSTSHTSGQYNHVHMADSAISRLKEEELKYIIEDTQTLIFDRRELFKNAALFPDSMKYNYAISSDKRKEDATTLHTSVFLNEYAKAIKKECFAEPVPPLPPNKFCNHRPDISCDTLFLNCPVPGSRICSETISGWPYTTANCPFNSVAAGPSLSTVSTSAIARLDRKLAAN